MADNLEKAALKRALLKLKTDEEDGTAQCVICLSSWRQQCFAYPCMHSFCFDCISKWVKTNPKCPLCRQTIKSLLHNIVSEDVYKTYIVEGRRAHNEHFELHFLDYAYGPDIFTIAREQGIIGPVTRSRSRVERNVEASPISLPSLSSTQAIELRELNARRISHYRQMRISNRAEIRYRERIQEIENTDSDNEVGIAVQRNRSTGTNALAGEGRNGAGARTALSAEGRLVMEGNGARDTYALAGEGRNGAGATTALSAEGRLVMEGNGARGTYALAGEGRNGASATIALSAEGRLVMEVNGAGGTYALAGEGRNGASATIALSPEGRLVMERNEGLGTYALAGEGRNGAGATTTALSAEGRLVMEHNASGGTNTLSAEGHAVMEGNGSTGGNASSEEEDRTSPK